MAIHPGSWGGLPDLGITEGISNLFGGSRNSQGGSNLVNDNVQNAVSSDLQRGFPALTGAVKTAGNIYQNNIYQPPSSVLGATNSNTQQNVPTNNQQPYGPPAPQNMNPAQQTDYAHSHGYDNWQMMQDAMQKANQGNSQADIQAITAEYDSLANKIAAQRPYIEGAYQTGLTDVNNQINDALNAGQTQKMDLNRTNQLATNQAYNNYLTSQRMNREAGRASGAGESSAYLDTQGQTNNSYGQTNANIAQDYQSKIQSIDSNITSIQNQGINAKQKLANQYNQSMSQIALDQNASDAQKVAAIAKVRAQADNISSQIDIQIAQMKQSLEIAKAQIAAYGGNITGLNTNMMANINNTPNANYGQSGQTGNAFSGLNIDQNKKQSMGL